MSGTTGVRAGFPTIKKYLKSFVLGGALDYEKEIADLTAYGQGKAVTIVDFDGYTSPYDIVNALQGLSDIARLRVWEAIQGALGGKADWEPTWRQAVAHDYWAARAHYAWHLQMQERFERGEVPNKIRMMFFRDWGVRIGNCLALGWFDFARNLAQSAEVAFRGEFFSDDASLGLCCRVQYFVLRLLGDWQGRPANATEPCVQDPVYTALLQSWRDPDAAALTPLLLAACDKHTQVARSNTDEESFDLSNNATWYTPFEILAVLRLRENLGLPLPSLDHPLMNTPLGRLPAVTAPFSDSLLASVLGTMAKQLPQLKLA